MKHLNFYLISVLIIFTPFISRSQVINTFPYFEDFENGNGGWTSGGTGTWTLGTPSKSTINSAASGSNSWVTGSLGGLYQNNANSFVESPEFDFSSLQQPVIQVNVWWECENTFDGAVLQSTTNNGGTWTNVGSLNDPNNWYNNGNIFSNPGGQPVGWSGRFGTGSGGWVLAENSMNNLIGAPSVKFRFAFGSDGSVQSEGFAFDDITIFDEKANDLGILQLVSPTQDCALGTEDVQVQFRNFGFQTQSNFGITYQVNNQTPVTEIYTGTIAKNQTVTYTFNQSVNLSANNNYQISVWMDLAADENRVNDSVLNRGLKSIMPIDPVDFSVWDGNNISSTIPGWSEGSGATSPGGNFSDWQPSDSAQTIFFGKTTARVNLFGTGQREWLVGPIFRVPQPSIFYFRAASTIKDGIASSAMGTDDKLEVLISNDCGSSWNTELTVDAGSGLDEVLRQFGVRLDGYVGQEIIIALKATDGPTNDTEDYDLHISDFEARFIYPNDAGLVTFTTDNGSQSINANSGTNIFLRLKNYGANSINTIPILAQIGNVNYQFVRYQNLGPNQEVNINIGAYYGSINGPAKVPVLAYTAYPSDTINSNDTLDTYLNVIGAIGVGLEDLGNEEIVIFPNPSVDGKYQIAMAEKENTLLKIYNAEGVYIKSIDLNKNKGIDISDQSKGVYFLEFIRGDLSFTKRLIYR